MWRRILCFAGIHNYQKLRLYIEYLEVRPGDLMSIIEQCECGHKRILRYEKPFILVYTNKERGGKT